MYDGSDIKSLWLSGCKIHTHLLPAAFTGIASARIKVLRASSNSAVLSLMPEPTPEAPPRVAAILAYWLFVTHPEGRARSFLPHSYALT